MIIHFNGFEYFIDIESDADTAMLLYKTATIVVDKQTKRITKNSISDIRGFIGTVDPESCDWIKDQKEKHQW